MEYVGRRGADAGNGKGGGNVRHSAEESSSSVLTDSSREASLQRRTRLSALGARTAASAAAVVNYSRVVRLAPCDDLV